MANLIRGKQISFGGQAERFIFTATNTSATVSGTDDAGETIAYTAGEVSVYLNGVKQVVGTDVTASNGTSVVFAANLTVDDVVEIVALSTYSAVTTEGTAILSTGETGGTKFLREDGDDSSSWQAIDSGSIASGAIDLAHMSVDSIDSDQYVDGSIDTAHIGNLQVTTGKIAADAIDGTKLADDAVDSEHYTDGSIDNAHIADDAIDSEHYAAGSIDTAHIADDQITLAKMASGTDGNIISYDASGDPVAIATGSDGQVLTSTGAGSPPAFEDAGGGGITGWAANGGNNDLLPASASAGIYLGVSSAVAANLLDDYEEGTWTPAETVYIGSRTGTWSSFVGTYTKIGRVVTLILTITGTSMGFSAAGGYMVFSGIPITASLGGSGAWACPNTLPNGVVRVHDGADHFILAVGNTSASTTAEINAMATYII